ncbi:MAG: DNA-processing protein DprA [Bacteroidota bacterium]
MDEKIYRIALSYVPKVGSITAKNLIAHCGSAKNVFQTSRKYLKKIPGIGDQIANSIKKEATLVAAQKEYDYLLSHNIQLLCHDDSSFPKRLLHFQDSPFLLFLKGNINLNTEKIVAIVGTRQPSHYGHHVCERIIEELSDQGILFVSGLAYGIDTIAHKKCNALKIPNVAVLGHGLNTIYPASHRQVANEIVKTGGLLSEYPSQVGPEREHFPMRNRIIAGMCDALLVVETALKGGSIISAEIANSYHKDIFAVPGRINDAKSAGCNHLIKKHKAALIEDGTDLIELMGWSPQTVSKQKSLFPDLDDQEKLLLDIIKNNSSCSTDFLAYQCNLSLSKLKIYLIGLECKGMIQSVAGNRYITLS